MDSKIAQLSTPILPDCSDLGYNPKGQKGDIFACGNMGCVNIFEEKKRYCCPYLTVYNQTIENVFWRIRCKFFVNLKPPRHLYLVGSETVKSRDSIYYYLTEANVTIVDSSEGSEEKYCSVEKMCTYYYYPFYCATISSLSVRANKVRAWRTAQPPSYLPKGCTCDICKID